MDYNDLLKIEEQLNLILTESYKKVVLNYPFKEEYYDFIKPNLFNDPNEVIKFNQEYRRKRSNKTWPHNFFIIGAIDRNNIYFIDTNDIKVDKIYFLSDEDRFNKDKIGRYLLNDDFEEFIEELKAHQEIHNNP